MNEVATIERRVLTILEQIAQAAKRAGRSANEITIVAASKRQPIEKMNAYSALMLKRGLPIIFGENYVQDFKKKLSSLNPPFNSHLIGHLQRNKAKEGVALFDVIETVDSFDLAHALDREAQKISKLQEIFVQINISKDSDKNGILPEQTNSFFDQLQSLKHIKLKGLMTITRLYDEPTDARADFKALRVLRDSLLPNFGALHLSMGMSQDFEVAIEEGATLVRLGTAIFGERE